MGVEEAEFTWLRAKTGSTDGNLGAQLMKLEEAGYVAVEKRFVLRKPQTLYRMTEAGRAALSEYVEALKQLLGGCDRGSWLRGSRTDGGRDRRVELRIARTRCMMPR